MTTLFTGSANQAQHRNQSQGDTMTTNEEPKFADFLPAELLAKLRDIQSRFIRMEDAVGKTIARADSTGGVLFSDGTWHSRHGNLKISEHDEVWKIPIILRFITPDVWAGWDKALTNFWTAKNQYDNEQRAIELLSGSANYVVIKKGEQEHDTLE